MFPSLAPPHLDGSPAGGGGEEGEGHIPVVWSTFTPTVLGPAWGAPRAHTTREDSNNTRPPNMAELGGLRFQFHFSLGEKSEQRSFKLNCRLQLWVRREARSQLRHMGHVLPITGTNWNLNLEAYDMCNVLSWLLAIDLTGRLQKVQVGRLQVSDPRCRLASRLL
jgi:hypothetical protein